MASAQNLELKQVDFYQPCQMDANGCQTDKMGWIVIADETKLPTPAQYDEPPLLSGEDKTTAWTSGGETKPIGYASGYRARVSASFERTDGGSFMSGCNGSNPTIYVRGRWLTNAPGEDPILVVKPTAVSSSGLVRTVGPLPFEIVFTPNLVRYIQDFQIQWEYASDIAAPSVAWKIAGNSIHPLYVTHVIPASSDYSPKSFFYTTLHRACVASNGFSTPENITATTYLQFEDQCVERVNENNDCMKYWGPKALYNDQDPWVFLHDRDGRCGSWQQFFSDILRVNGIGENLFNIFNEVEASDAPSNEPYESVPVTVTAYDFHKFGGVGTGLVTGAARQQLLSKIQDYFGNLFDPNEPCNSANAVYLVGNGSFIYSYFFVKEYTFNNVNQLYLDSPVGGLPLNAPGNPPYDKIFGANNFGTMAQGNGDPQSSFNNHAIQKCIGNFFDPSYGSGIMTSKNTWVENSLSGIGARLRYRDELSLTTDIYWVQKNSNFADDIKFTIAK